MLTGYRCFFILPGYFRVTKFERKKTRRALAFAGFWVRSPANAGLGPFIEG